MKRTIVIFASMAFLGSCAFDRDEPAPCGTCPEPFVEVTVACETCDLSAPIELRIENPTGKSFTTDLCSWQLFGIKGQRHAEEIQIPDCTLVDPGPVAIAGGGATYLSVQVDGALLPDLEQFDSLYFRLTIWWFDGQKSELIDIQSNFFNRNKI